MATVQVELPANNYITAIVSKVAKNNNERDLQEKTPIKLTNNDCEPNRTGSGRDWAHPHPYCCEP